ncbi:MAG: class I SAM-dependent methyltransferase [Thermoplasmata archaeon]
MASKPGHLSRELRYYVHFGRLVGVRAMVGMATEYVAGRSMWPWYDALKSRVNDGKGLEIGGPSRIFGAKGPVPIYPFLASCDNVDFAQETLWTPASAPGQNGGATPVPNGSKVVSDATHIPDFNSASYDVLLSSHVIEHLANPLRALKESKRLLKTDGVLLAVVPDGARTFDHRRPVTSLEHIIHDFDNHVEEDDLSHLEEVLELHDLSMDPGAGSREEFVARSYNNARVRALHHHVFSMESFGGVLGAAGFSVKVIASLPPDNILAYAVPSRESQGKSEARATLPRRLND